MTVKQAIKIYNKKAEFEDQIFENDDLFKSVTKFEKELKKNNIGAYTICPDPSEFIFAWGTKEVPALICVVFTNDGFIRVEIAATSDGSVWIGDCSFDAEKRGVLKKVIDVLVEKTNGAIKGPYEYAED